MEFMEDKMLNYWSIPIHGYVAAAYTTLMQHFLLFLFHFLNAKHILREKDIILVGRVLSNLWWTILAALILIFTIKYINIFIISLIVKVLFTVFVGWLFFFRNKLNKITL